MKLLPGIFGAVIAASVAVTFAAFYGIQLFTVVRPDCFYEGVNVSNQFGFVVKFGFWAYATQSALLLLAALSGCSCLLLVSNVLTQCLMTLILIAQLVCLGVFRFAKPGAYCSRGVLYAEGQFLMKMFVAQLCLNWLLSACACFGIKQTVVIDE